MSIMRISTRKRRSIKECKRKCSRPAIDTTTKCISLFPMSKYLLGEWVSSHECLVEKEIRKISKSINDTIIFWFTKQSVSAKKQKDYWLATCNPRFSTSTSSSVFLRVSWSICCVVDVWCASSVDCSESIFDCITVTWAAVWLRSVSIFLITSQHTTIAIKSTTIITILFTCAMVHTVRVN